MVDSYCILNMTLWNHFHLIYHRRVCTVEKWQKKTDDEEEEELSIKQKKNALAYEYDVNSI